MELLKQRSKDMVACISAALKTIQSIDTPSSRCARALDAAITILDVEFR